jgi:hypothetical protein
VVYTAVIWLRTLETRGWVAMPRSAPGGIHFDPH